MNNSQNYQNYSPNFAQNSRDPQNYPNLNSKKPKKSRKKLIFFAIILPVLWILGGTIFFANFNNIRDQITVWQNPLDAQIAELSDEAGLNSRGKFLLAASRAELNDDAEFNENCEIREAQEILLGCFTLTEKRIYVFNVEDSRISGMNSVTTAHEMLHAAYARLSGGERAKVDEMLAREAENIDNSEISDMMKIYAKTEPGEEFNELHSLLATEEKNLTPELENYYKTYFENREKVVKKYEDYAKVFADFEAEITNLQSEIAGEEAEIKNLSANYESDLTIYESDVSKFNTCAQTENCFSSQNAFDSQRASLVARQKTLQNAADEINAKIAKYNENAEKLNALGVEAQKLNDAIDSHATEVE